MKKTNKKGWTEAFLKNLGFTKRCRGVLGQDWYLEGKSKTFELMEFNYYGYRLLWIRSKKNLKQSFSIKIYDRENFKKFISINNN